MLLLLFINCKKKKLFALNYTILFLYKNFFKCLNFIFFLFVENFLLFKFKISFLKSNIILFLFFLFSKITFINLKSFSYKNEANII